MQDHSPPVEIATPLRLHFGLFSFGEGQTPGYRPDVPVRHFGGVGAMVGLSGPRVRISTATRLESAGPLAERATEFARRWGQSQRLPDAPACHIEIVSSPPEHCGLGVGTQLALAVAAGLNLFLKLPMPSPAELALSVGRGLRSAVGTYGFGMGGLIVEQGKLPGEPISPLDCRLDLPEAWRFALVRPRVGSGLAGQVEQEAFAHLPPVPPAVTEQLVEEVRERMIPAAALANFDDFSESVYEFGRAAALCFADRQGGPYNGPLLTSLVEEIRALGVRGVGQSSWGPTLFALLPSDSDFPRFAAQLAERFATIELEMDCVSPNNRGMRVEIRCPRETIQDGA